MYEEIRESGFKHEEVSPQTVWENAHGLGHYCKDSMLQKSEVKAIARKFDESETSRIDTTQYDEGTNKSEEKKKRVLEKGEEDRAGGEAIRRLAVINVERKRARLENDATATTACEHRRLLIQCNADFAIIPDIAYNDFNGIPADAPTPASQESVATPVAPQGSQSPTPLVLQHPKTTSRDPRGVADSLAGCWARI